MAASMLPQNRGINEQPPGSIEEELVLPTFLFIQAKQR
jgi:hypothetical protein